MTEAAIKVIGIGASAGGLEAFRLFFQAMPPDSGFAFVVVLHLPANRRSMLPDIIARWTKMRVIGVDHEALIEPNCIYVPQPHAVVSMGFGRLQVTALASDAPREDRTIDAFFDSLARSLGENAVGIVLSGTGTDGSLGLKAIKECGGVTMAQGHGLPRRDGSGPQFEGMPAGAIATGAVDLVVEVGAMPGHLLRLRDALKRRTPGADAASAGQARQRICDIMRAQLGHDFSGYKEPTFLRRVQRRMQMLNIAEYDGYVVRLEADRDEVATLFRELLIRVTSFFRDLAVFEVLATVALPRLFEGKRADGTVRVWVPGCATGEEAYSLAILLCEHLDGLANAPKVQIFATDIDEPAIAMARAGRYPTSLLDGLSEARRARFFIDTGAGTMVAKEIRELCTFSSHSLVRDPPFSRMDLVSCRNLLIYLNNDLQSTVIPTFHYALNSNGILLLGNSETVSRFDDLFVPLDKAARIFLRRDVPSPSPRFFWPGGNVPGRVVGIGRSDHDTALQNTAGWPRSAVRSDSAGGAANGEAEGGSDGVGIGGRATGQGRLVEALRDGIRGLVGWFFPDLRDAASLRRDLAATRAQLRELTEEHGTAVEELRSANEELLSVNEEIQSTNEELETSKEEIQSVNEELHTVNAQLSGKIEELDRANSDLRNLFASTDVATVFMDRELVIRGFTPALNAIYNVIPSDHGRPLTDIVSRLNYGGLRADVREVLASLEPVERQVAHEDGESHYIMRVLPYRGADQAVNGVLVTFLNVTSIVRAERQQKMLVDELNHRVKNMLTVVISLATQTLRRSAGLAEFSDAFLGRVHALNASYSLLSRENWGAVSLRDVLAEETGALQFCDRAADGPNFIIEGPLVLLMPQAALALGMALHELATNAVKYGALSEPTGVVTVRWRFAREAEGTQLVVEWIEQGGPRVTAPTQRGFGMTIIERQLAHEFSGRARVDFLPDGVRARLSVPLGPAIRAAEEAG